MALDQRHKFPLGLSELWITLPRFAFQHVAVAACVSLIGLAMPATAQERSATLSSTKWHPWFEIGGSHDGDDTASGEVTVFAPIFQSINGLAFIEARGQFFEDDVKDGNLAAGYRQMTTSGFNLGVWIGGDVRRSAIENTFWQLSGGVEALSHNFEARVNWYGPVTSPQEAGVASFTEVRLEGNGISMVGGEEVGLKGVDGEIGVRLPLEVLSLDPGLFELRIYGGGFYFDDDAAVEDIAGGKGRVELAINDVIAGVPGSRLSAEYAYSYDDVREDLHKFGARLRIPFGVPGVVPRLSRLTGQERRMLVGLERDTGIVTAKSKAEDVSDALTGVDFDRVAFVKSGGSLTDTSAASGDNSLIIVNGTVSDGTQTIAANQTVQGGGSTIQVRGRKSGTVAGFAAPGSRGTVTNAGGGNVIALSAPGNIHVAGLLIDGQNTGTNGVSGGSGITNVAITQNVIQNTGADGINFNDDNSKILIADTTIRTTGGEGIFFDNDNSDVTISDVLIDSTGDVGIEFDQRNSGVRIAGVSVRNTGSDGISFQSFNRDVEISDTSVTNTGSEGIIFNNDNAQVRISGVTISGTGAEGIEFDQRNTDVSIRNSSISATGSDGINFGNLNQSVTISGNTIDSSNEGIQFGNDNTSVSIANNTIASDNEAIEFNQRNSGTISGNTLTNAAGDAIDLQNQNVFTIIGNRFNFVGDDAIRIGSDNTVTISDNVFAGPIGGQILDVDGGGANLLSGSGNVANGPVTCQSGTFAGQVIVSGVVLQDGAAPCN